MTDIKYYTTLLEVFDEAITYSINNVTDIGRLNDVAIETSKRLKDLNKKQGKV